MGATMKLNVVGYTGGDNRETMNFANDDVGASPTPYTYTYPTLPSPSNRLDRVTNGSDVDVAFVHDALGRRERDDDTTISGDERDYVYTAGGHLGAVTKPVPTTPGNYTAHTLAAAYDHQRRRIFRSWIDSETEQQSQWFTFYGPSGEVLEEKYVPDASVPLDFTLYTYVYLEGWRVMVFSDDYDPCAPPQPGACLAASRREYYENDHLGTPVVLTNWPAAGDAAVTWQADYDALGWAHPRVDPSRGDDYQPFRFPGQMEDIETEATVWDPANPGFQITLRPALSYNWHRTYDPYTGAYLQPDPMNPTVRAVLFWFEPTLLAPYAYSSTR
jgi:hypothetical protein